MDIVERLKRLARLGGIIGVAASSLALSYCSSATRKVDAKIPDAIAADAAPDAKARDAGPPDGAIDGSGPGDSKPKLDKKLWDVMCE